MRIPKYLARPALIARMNEDCGSGLDTVQYPSFSTTEVKSRPLKLNISSSRLAPETHFFKKHRRIKVIKIGVRWLCVKWVAIYWS
jgi:hypothetical protein